MQREGAAVGETVERATTSEAAGFDAVLGLVEECAGLLALEEIGDELDLALEVFDRAGRRAAQHSLAQRQVLVRAHLDVVAFDDGPRHAQLLQQRGEHLASQVGRFDQRLHAEAVGVAVDDQAGEEIRLAVHQPPGVAAVGVGRDGVAHRFGPLEPPGEKLLVDGLVFSREQAHGDLAPGAVERLAQEPPALVDEPNDLAAW